ncbi:hypothetical protein [Streptomyces sp. NPDC058613]
MAVTALEIDDVVDPTITVDCTNRVDGVGRPAGPEELLRRV